MLQSAKLSLFTPFKVNEEFEAVDEDESLDMLKKATDAAVKLLKSPEILQIVKKGVESIDGTFDDK